MCQLVKLMTINGLSHKNQSESLKHGIEIELFMIQKRKYLDKEYYSVVPDQKLISNLKEKYQDEVLIIKESAKFLIEFTSLKPFGNFLDISEIKEFSKKVWKVFYEN